MIITDQLPRKRLFFIKLKQVLNKESCSAMLQDAEIEKEVKLVWQKRRNIV